MQLVVAAVPYHHKTTAHAKARHRWAWASSRSIDIVDGEETSTRVASLAWSAGSARECQVIAELFIFTRLRTNQGEVG